MNVIELAKSVLLGIVEGITEWLPISSTGHMILVDEFVQLSVYADDAANTSFINMYLVVIQLGAILAVCALFFHELNPLSPRKEAAERKSTCVLWGKIILGCIPAAVIGVPLNDWMEAHLYNSVVVAAALIIYGIAFLVIETWRAHSYTTVPVAPDTAAARVGGAHFAVAPTQTRDASPHKLDADTQDVGAIATLDELSWKIALGIGCFQVLSLVPGTSRSGSTIIGGLLLGCTREVASKFTFFLAIPVMCGASLLKVLKFFLKGGSFDMFGTLVLLVGCVVAFVVSLLTIRWLMHFVRCHDFKVFGVYRIILGVVVLLYFLLPAPTLKL